VTDPLLVDPDYPLRTVQDLASRQGLEADEPLAVAVIVTVAVPSGMTANLFAPLAMGTRTRLGVQVILHDSPYQVRHAL
jgi:flagellar assembly factor FliW